MPWCALSLVSTLEAYSRRRFRATTVGLNQSPQGENIKTLQIVAACSNMFCGPDWIDVSHLNHKLKFNKTTWILTGEFHAHCCNVQTQCSQETVPAIGVKTLAVLLKEDLDNKARPNTGRMHHQSLQRDISNSWWSNAATAPQQIQWSSGTRMAKVADQL